MTEYHSKGSIAEIIESKNEKLNPHNAKLLEKCQLKKIIRYGLPNLTCRMYFIDILKALYYCHKIIKVIHRDIKPENIMINHNNEAVLIDFGVSALVDG